MLETRPTRLVCKEPFWEYNSSPAAPPWTCSIFEEGNTIPLGHVYLPREASKTPAGHLHKGNNHSLPKEAQLPLGWGIRNVPMETFSHPPLLYHVMFRAPAKLISWFLGYARLLPLTPLPFWLGLGPHIFMTCSGLSSKVQLKCHLLRKAFPCHPL